VPDTVNPVRFAAALLAVALAVGPALAADPADPGAPAAPATSTPNPATSLLSDLKAQQETRAGDPDFDYLLGVAALEAGELQLALDALERVVLHRPTFAGAWLDLALVHTRLNDAASAEAILAHVESSFDPPPALRAQIAQARRLLAPPPLQAATRGWHGDLALLAGTTSNANAGLAVSGFSLTPLDLPQVPVAVDPDQRPRRDNQLQIRGSLYRDFAHDNGSTTSLLGYLRGRQYASENDFSFYELAGGISHARPLAPGLALTLGSSARQLQLGGASLATFYTASLGLRREWQACNAQASGEYEYRDYSREGYFSADILWAGGGVDCRRGSHSVSLAARVGRDQPRSQSGIDRAGGDTTRLEASLLWRWQWTQQWSSDLLVYYVHNRDASGYSPLLADDATRRVERLGQRLTLQRSLDAAGRWRLLLEAENGRDYSNLPIFRLEERQVSVGLRYLF